MTDSSPSLVDQLARLLESSGDRPSWDDYGNDPLVLDLLADAGVTIAKY